MEMKSTFKTFISLVLLMLTAGVQTARADQDPVQYWHHGWDEVKKRVTNYSSNCTNYKVLDSSTNLNDGDFGVGSYWEGYDWVVVKGQVTLDALIVHGTGHLILTDDCVLTVTGGVLLEGSNTLSIYSQSSDANQGKMIVTQSNKDCAAIGGRGQRTVDGQLIGMGTLIIHGGNISATGATNGAGIGGGEDRGIQGSLTIYGGTISATGGEDGAGIGGGWDGSQGGTVTIYGGTVTATGGSYGAGIGGGCTGRWGYASGGYGGRVEIYGGTVTATSGKDSSGIGAGGKAGNYMDFYMEGGTVTATGDGYAGVGARYLNASSTQIDNKIVIKGGTLHAKGKNHGIGGLLAEIDISGGDDITVESTGSGPGIQVGGGRLNISGGNIMAKGMDGSAGISVLRDPINTWGHHSDSYAYITISGGNVTAIGGSEGGAGIGNNRYESTPATLTITGGTVTATGYGGGAGIGGGNGTVLYSKTKVAGITISSNEYVYGAPGITVIIQGGTVEATGSTGAMAIGSGALPNNRALPSSMLTLAPNLQVMSGLNASSAFLQSTAMRLAGCHGTYAKVEDCAHAKFASCTYDDVDQHTKYCAYCKTGIQEQHSYTDNICACGKEFNEDTDTWMVTLNQASSNTATAYDNITTYKVVKGQPFVIPVATDIDGLQFMGWLQTATTPADCEMRDDEFLDLKGCGLTLTPSADVALYARYRCQYDMDWAWTSDRTSATVTVTWRNGDTATGPLVATVYDESDEVTENHTEGKYSYRASASFEKSTGVTYQFTDFFDIPYLYCATLNDDADNSTVLASCANMLVKSVGLQGRTFYCDGMWNTLCLPFDVYDDDETDAVAFTGTILEGATVKTLESTAFDEVTGALTLNFADADYIKAGRPYIVKWTPGAGESASIVENPYFNDVYITATPVEALTTDDDCVTFQGCYSPTVIYEEGTEKHNLYLGDANTLYYPTAEGFTVNACRAYFTLKDDLIAGEPSSQQANVRAFVLNFGDDSTGIISVSKESRSEGVADAWYSLDGRKLNVKPTAKGLYINNGRKIIIK